MHTGTLFTISAPSGAGKTSLVNELLNDLDNIQVSVSHTTRPSRPGEVEGVNYNFVTKEQFINMLNGNAFLEHAEVHGNYYGTSEQWVKESLARGTDVILEIDWQGAAQIRKLFPGCVGIFILPPSKQALRERLTGRGQDDATVIDKRVAAATEEMSHYAEADYLVINDQFEDALEELKAIVIAGRCHISLKQQSAEKLLEDLLS